MIGRYLRAFMKALSLTLRGEKLPEDSVSRQMTLLRQWTAVLAERVTVIQEVAAKGSFDMQQVVVQIDKRNMTMKTIVDLLEYRAHTEYPNLLNAAGKSGWAVIYTSNHNDVYYVDRLFEVLDESPVKQAVEAVKAHLETLPLQTGDVSV